ncbi:MAG: hypothetical protein ACXWC4_11315 [Telluria sp.]
MRNRLMTSAELDALERRWKCVLLVAGIVLMLDIAYLFTIFPAGRAKHACWFFAALAACACVFALRQLHKAGYREARPDNGGGDDGWDVPDLIDSLPDFGDHD